MTGIGDELERILAAHERETDASSPAAAARRQTVLALHAAGRLSTPALRVAAARVLAAGSTVEAELAQSLALAAVGVDAGARRVAAEAYDRLRVLAGKPQKYGTQTVRRDGRVELWPVDAATTDSERAKWGVEPLAALQQRAAMMRP